MMQQPLPQTRSRLCYDRLEVINQQLSFLEQVVGGDEFLSAQLQQLSQVRAKLANEALEQLQEEVDLPLLESSMELLEIATLLATGEENQARALAEGLPAHLRLLFQESLQDEEAPLMLCAIGLAMAHSGNWSPSQEEIEAHLDEAMEVLDESIALAIEENLNR